MATLDQCQEAVAELARRLTQAGDTVRTHATDRTISCRVLDLAVTFMAQLSDGELTDLQVVPMGAEPDPAQIKLTITSDDLVALVDGTLAFPSAWATGRVRLDASFRDLLKLRSMLG